ncbi:MAG: hypothetical protein ACD_62C00174G0001 [uncultured bacterium]|nr:MAG: hypothetical protein ACD_62C00174G0001 [uncultured bacterium]
MTINAGNDVARWSIRLDMSRSFKNGKAHEALVAFLGELLGVDFRQGSVGVALHAYEEAMLPNSTYDAKVAGLGSLRLDLFAGDGISCAVAFEPSERGYLPEVTLAFLNGLYEKLRGLEQWEPSHQI